MMLDPLEKLMPEMLFPDWRPWVVGTLMGLAASVLLLCCCCCLRPRARSHELSKAELETGMELVELHKKNRRLRELEEENKGLREANPAVQLAAAQFSFKRLRQLERENKGLHEEILRLRARVDEQEEWGEWDAPSGGEGPPSGGDDELDFDEKTFIGMAPGASHELGRAGQQPGAGHAGEQPRSAAGRDSLRVPGNWMSNARSSHRGSQHGQHDHQGHPLISQSQGLHMGSAPEQVAMTTSIIV